MTGVQVLVVPFPQTINSDMCSDRIRHQFRNISNCFIEEIPVPLHDSEGRNILAFFLSDERPTFNFIRKSPIAELFFIRILIYTRWGFISSISNRKKLETFMEPNSFIFFCFC